MREVIQAAERVTGRAIKTVDAPRRAGDPAVRRLVAELRRASPLFERLWATHDVAVQHADRKRILHPAVGLLELDCEVLLTPAHDQRLILHTAQPGTESAEKLELLRVVGRQRLLPQPTG